MTANATPALPQRQYQFPKSGMNPLLASTLVCPQRKCHRLLEPIDAQEDPATGQLLVRYHCDGPECGYDFLCAPAYSQGQYVAPGARKPKRPPEVHEPRAQANEPRG